MRETRPSGSEGGGTPQGVLPTPICLQAGVARRVNEHWLGGGKLRRGPIGPLPLPRVWF